FDPGIPLRDGRFLYALVENGVQVIDAAWPLGEGQITIDPFTWAYSAAENQVILRVSGVEVGEFLKDFGEGRLSATGTLEGRIPVIVRGIEVLVQGGRLDVPGGGLIRYRGDDALIEKIPNQYAADAIKALEDFKYDSLFAEIDGPLGGEIKVGLAFTGNNKDVLFGVPFAFDMSVEGELFNIARSFNTNATIKSQIGSNFRLSE
ncbi:MAG: YdbH domain-containing protein, partial [Pseudomonadota bacterium]